MLRPLALSCVWRIFAAAAASSRRRRRVCKRGGGAVDGRAAREDVRGGTAKVLGGGLEGSDGGLDECAVGKLDGNSQCASFLRTTEGLGANHHLDRGPDCLACLHRSPARPKAPHQHHRSLLLSSPFTLRIFVSFAWIIRVACLRNHATLRPLPRCAQPLAAHGARPIRLLRPDVRRPAAAAATAATTERPQRQRMVSDAVRKW
jgi:hypothetical protein